MRSADGWEESNMWIESRQQVGSSFLLQQVQILCSAISSGAISAGAIFKWLKAKITKF